MWPFDMFSKKMKYTAKESGSYTWHGKTISWPKGYQSDGATYAPDLSWTAFFAHDRVCETGKWDDGTEVTNWEASTMYSDILKDKGFWFRQYHRKYLTRWFGGKKLRAQDKARTS